MNQKTVLVVASLLALALAGQPVATAWGAGRPDAPRELARDTVFDPAQRTQEKLLRGAYLKLMRYQRAYAAEAAKAPALPADELQIELYGVRTGWVGEILELPLGELASAGTGRLLQVQPIVYKFRDGPAHLVYRAELRDATDLAEWEGWDGLTVADHLRRMGPAGQRAEMYTAYEVALTLAGERRTYRAFAVYGAGGQDTLEVIDNILGSRTVSDLVSAELPPVRSPWARYLQSPTYAAVARAIDEARRAGRSPIPAGAPAGSLAGDGVVPEAPAVHSARAEAAKAALCAPVTVGALRAEVPATGQPQVSDFLINANSTVAFAGDTAPDLVVLFQGSVPMTVTAMNVEPAPAEAQLRWKLERDPTDTVALGLPTLDATGGPQVRVTPGTAGNFRLICFTDTNGSGQYEAGEEKKVLRFAVVRGTVNASFCSFISGGVGFVTAAELNPGEMALAMDQSIDAAGMNFDCQVILEGGGTQRNIGIGKVMLGNVGNLRATSAQVVYAPAPGASAPLGYEQPVATPPMLDARAMGSGGEAAFRSQSSQSDPSPGPGGNGLKFRVSGFDPPGAGPWKIRHPFKNTDWATTQGGYDFREFVAGFTTSFQKAYVVFAAGDWSVRIVGRNDSGVWRNTGSTITLQGQPASSAPRLTLAVTGTTPQTGDVAGMRVTGPNYSQENNRPFAYSLGNLTAPTLSATAGNAQARLTWTAPAGARTYNVKRSATSGGPYATVAPGLTATTYTDMGVQNGTTYYFVVTAVDGALESPSSNQVSVTPTSGATQPPTAPKNLVATRGTGQITLTWSGGGGADTYKVKRSTANGGPYTPVAEGLSQTTYTNTGLTKGVTYYYVVTAVNGAGESPVSNQASATP